MNILRVVLVASGLGLGGILAAASQGANTTAPAAAPSAEAIAVAKELMALVSGDLIGDLTGKMVAWPTVEQSLQTQYRQRDAATSGELRTEFEKQIAANVAEAMNDAPAIYARYMTIAEMRDIQAFYRTPTGAKTLKLMPQISSEVMGQFFPRMQSMIVRVNSALVDILQKHGYTAK